MIDHESNEPNRPRLTPEQIEVLARAACESEVGERLHARYARSLMIGRVAGGEWREIAAGIAEAPDAGAAMAEAAFEDLSEEDQAKLAQLTGKLTFAACLIAAEELEAGAASMLIDPEGIEPEGVALMAGTQSVARLIRERAKGAADGRR